NIKIKRDESLFFNLMPNFRDEQYISAFLFNMGLWKSKNNISLMAGKDIVSQGIKYYSNKEITFNAGQDIFLASKLIKEAAPFFSDIHYPQLQSKLFSDNNLILNAARDIDLSSTVLNSKDKIIVLAGRNIKLGANAYSAIEDPHEDAQDIQYTTTSIMGNKGISIASSGSLTTEGSSLKSEGDIAISSGGNIQLGSVRTHFRKESDSELEELRKQVSTEINSGNHLTLLSEGSILFQASQLAANKKMDIAAKGGFLYAQAMEESSYYEEEKKKCNWWTLCATKKKYTKTFNNTTNKVTEFIANDDINLIAKDDITLEASKLETAKNAKLTSKTGGINFKAVKDTAFKQVITRSKDIYITQRNQGYTKGTWLLPELYIGGKLTIDAPKGISADIKAKKEQSLEQALTALSNTPEYAWLNALQRQENINWNLVKDTYSSWDDKTQQLNPVVGAVIAIAVGVATYGTATAASIGGMASNATIAAGASAGVASTASVAAQAGFASLVSQAAVSLAENQGNISKTFGALSRSDTVKSIVTSMTVAGALQGLDQFMGWDQAIQGGTLPTTGKLLATDNATWTQVAQRVASQSVVSSTLGTAIQGGSFIDNFKTALLSHIGSQFHAEGANLIGDNGAILGHAGKVLSHATLSGLSAQISGGNVNGAVIGSLAAEIAAISLGDNTIKAEEWQKRSESQAQFVRLFGGIAGGIFTGEPGGVYSGARGAENSFRYNYLSHHQQKLMEKELSAETNYFKKTAIYLKWLSVDIGQDTAFSGGLVAGIPSGLYETIDGLASLATNPLETYQAIKAVIQSDNAFDTLTQAVKQSYIERIEKLEAEYQKAGVSGSFNAGVESGKLIFDLVGLFAGGAGVAKGSSQLIAKTSAKIIEKTTRFSFPDGISFQIELPKHLATVDKFTQKMGISGGHNANVFYNVVKDKNLKIIKQTPTSVRGIMYIEYKIPAKHPQTGEITHYKGNGAQPFKKTIYDPKIFSDQKILELGQKAAANGYKNALDKNLQSYDAMSEGITFRVYLDKETKMVTNFHPK
ncbi:TPA: DUF637 domain-containing protein, partial [Proteus mirabilis]|nr:DUF637 domain-containing protein [Proteus mirabilis]